MQGAVFLYTRSMGHTRRVFWAPRFQDDVPLYPYTSVPFAKLIRNYCESRPPCGTVAVEQFGNANHIQFLFDERIPDGGEWYGECCKEFRQINAEVRQGYHLPDETGYGREMKAVIEGNIVSLSRDVWSAVVAHLKMNTFDTISPQPMGNLRIFE